MLSPYKMSRIIITGPNSVQEQVIRELHSLKAVHIVEHSKNELADIGKPLESAGRLSEVLVKARSLASVLKIKKEKTDYEMQKSLPEIESAIKRLNDEVSASLDELKKAEDSISKINAVRQELEMLEGMAVPLEALQSYRSLACFTGYVSGNAKESLHSELSGLTGNFALFAGASKKKSLIMLFIDTKNKEAASGLLQKSGFSPVIFSGIQGLKGTASANLKKTGDELEKLQKKRDEISKRIERIGNEQMAFLMYADEFLSEQLERAEAPLKFASTPSSFLIKGWIPSDSLKQSMERLSRAGNNRVFIDFEPAKKSDKVPVKLDNPKYAKPFEFFMNLYSLPTYGEIDPTFFVFLTFPIFFGIMLGDIGYGIVSLVIFYILKKKMPEAGKLFNILLLASLVTVLFGSVFGEFFGMEIYHPLVSREHEMNKLMAITIAIGVIHVNLGLAIGFLNELRHHGIVHAIYTKASWIVLEMGFALLVLSYLKIVSISMWIGAVFLAVSVLMLLKGEGFKGIIELPAIFTNILSYVRLTAIGVSSVILALIVNESVEKFFHKGGFFVVVGIIILIVGHMINIMIGWLGSFLHSLRLHYVEFFSKFFHGGAEKYRPFGARE